MAGEGPGGNILVFDVGSSALKASVFDAEGAIVDRIEVGYGLAARVIRQSPWDWWKATVAAAHQLDLRGIAAIVLTGTMENLIPIAESGEPLGDALLYADPCGQPFLAEALPALSEAAATRLCGNAPEPLMTAFKLGWLARHEPERFAAARWFLPGAKDFLVLKLTGEAVTDPTCAATTGLMDIVSRDWSDPLRTIAGVERVRLPRIRPATDIVGRLVAMAADELGLPAGLPVVNGAGDGGTTTVGAGADDPGDVSLYLGTTGWAARAFGSAEPRAAGFYKLPHPLNEGLIEIAPILSAGAAAAWARQALGVEAEAAEGLAQQADAAPGEVVFAPYLGGERSPFLDLEVRGAFLGLSSSDGPPELYYAVLEGVALAIDANLTAMGGRPGKVCLVGGGALSRTWPQMIADILEAPILSSAEPAAATSRGAFRIAQRALRLPATEPSFAVLANPRPERAARARHLRQRFAHATSLVRQFR